MQSLIPRGISRASPCSCGNSAGLYVLILSSAGGWWSRSAAGAGPVGTACALPWAGRDCRRCAAGAAGGAQGGASSAARPLRTAGVSEMPSASFSSRFSAKHAQQRQDEWGSVNEAESMRKDEQKARRGKCSGRQLRMETAFSWPACASTLSATHPGLPPHARQG